VQTFGLRAITVMVSTNSWFGFLNKFKVVSKFLVIIEFQEIQQYQLRRV
jgi:ATP adenylyltransferase/5',5'''-P-1,P-4-tetraphosphate phosphorylase II